MPSVAAFVDADRDQDTHVFDFTAPGAFEPDAVEEDVRVPAFDRAVASGVDLVGDFLVQFAHCRGADSGAPERLGDVLNPAHGNAGKVHLNQRFFDRALATLVALDDRSLKGQFTQLRHAQGYFAGLGLQLAFVVAGTGVESRDCARRVSPRRAGRPPRRAGC
jgi:hypothetical protein